MKVPQKRTGTDRETRKALEDVGGDALEGSGFEQETPEPEFNSRDRHGETPRN